jgi:hypothetical protein
MNAILVAKVVAGVASVIFCLCLLARLIRLQKKAKYDYSVYWMAGNGFVPGYYYTILKQGKSVGGDGPYSTQDGAALIAKMDHDLWNRYGKGLHGRFTKGIK